MKICHFSDLHSDYTKIESAPDVDVWFCTGDFFPNFTNPRKTPAYRLKIERESQTEWWESILPHFNSLLRNKPIFWVGGNHDFIDPYGLDNLEYINAGDVVKYKGYNIGGFREIPMLNGFWAGEVEMQEMIKVCRIVFEKPIDILITHTPPRGVLDNISFWGTEEVGSMPLRNYLAYSDVKVHCFGHIHEQGGKVKIVDGILYSNAATTFNVFEV